VPSSAFKLQGVQQLLEGLSVTRTSLALGIHDQREVERAGWWVTFPTAGSGSLSQGFSRPPYRKSPKLCTPSDETPDELGQCEQSRWGESIASHSGMVTVAGPQ